MQRQNHRNKERTLRKLQKRGKRPIRNTKKNLEYDTKQKETEK